MSPFFDCLTFKDGTDRFSPKRLHETVILRCVKSQKSADLIYTGAETRNYAQRRVADRTNVTDGRTRRLS